MRAKRGDKTERTPAERVPLARPNRSAEEGAAGMASFLVAMG